MTRKVTIHRREGEREMSLRHYVSIFVPSRLIVQHRRLIFRELCLLASIRIDPNVCHKMSIIAKGLRPVNRNLFETLDLAVNSEKSLHKVTETTEAATDYVRRNDRSALDTKYPGKILLSTLPPPLPPAPLECHVSFTAMRKGRRRVRNHGYPFNLQSADRPYRQ